MTADFWAQLVEAGARALYETWRLSVAPPTGADDWKFDVDWETMCRWADTAGTKAPKYYRDLAIAESDAALRAAFGKLIEALESEGAAVEYGSATAATLRALMPPEPGHD